MWFCSLHFTHFETFQFIFKIFVWNMKKSNFSSANFIFYDRWLNLPKKRNFILILLIQKKIYVMMSTGGDICLIFTKVWLWTLNNISENLWTCILTCCKFSEDLIVQSNTWMQTCGWRVHEIDPWWIGFVFNLNFHKSLRTPLKHFYSGFIKGIFLKKNLSFCN